MNSPQSLKKILSLSEEATERHRKQTEDAVSSTSSPPTSPRSSPKKGKDSLSILTHTHAHTLAEILEDYINESVSHVSKYLNELYGRSVLI